MKKNIIILSISIFINNIALPIESHISYKIKTAATLYGYVIGITTMLYGINKIKNAKNIYGANCQRRLQEEVNKSHSIELREYILNNNEIFPVADLCNIANLCNK